MTIVFSAAGGRINLQNQCVTFLGTLIAWKLHLLQKYRPEALQAASPFFQEGVLMNTRHDFIRILRYMAAFVLFATSATTQALTVNWVDWQSASNLNGFTAVGTITTPTSTVTVTYNNPNGVGFFQTGAAGEIDYWTQGSFGSLGRDPTRSPYTSTGVNGNDNIPVGTDLIALQFAGTQTLTFSEAIANPFFSYVSLNGNGYAFNQDFDILSFGNASDGNDIGYWGNGASTKTISGAEYQLLGTGEPHGTLRFTGSFNTVTWRSLSNEFWNGFTVGIQGTTAEVNPCDINPTLPQCNGNPAPVPAPLLLLAFGLLGLGLRARRR
jgi:hypothetical protein